MSDSNPVKPPRERPALAHWLWSRGYTWKEAGALFGCSGEAARLWCLPFDDPMRRRPEDPFIERIRTITGGQVGPEHFFPPAPLPASIGQLPTAPLDGEAR